MNRILFNDAMSNIDDDIVAAFLENKEKMQKNAKSRQHRLWKFGALAAAICLLVVTSIAGIVYFYPVQYELDYVYTGSNGEESGIPNENIWIYYVEGNRLHKERVTLPSSAENVFLAWKYRNDIGDDIAFVSCNIRSNGTESSYTFDGQNISKYEQGDYFQMIITLAGDLESYATGNTYNLLMESLKQSMTKYSNIDFDEITFVFE